MSVTADPPRPRRAYRPAAESRAAIVRAAQEAFARSAFGGARTRDIAAAAGVNQATLFRHFPSKEALFEEAVLRPVTEALGTMHGSVDVYAQARSPAEMGRFAEQSTARHLEDMERILPLFAAALFSDVERGRMLFAEHLEPLLRRRGAVLRPLVRDGIDPDFVGLASFGMMLAVALQRRFGGDDGDRHATAAQFNRLLTQGFADPAPELPSG